MNDKNISKHIRFSSQVVDVLEKEAKEMGYNFNEWVKFLITQRALSLKEKYEKDLIRRYNEALKESSENKTVKLKSPTDIKKFFANLENE